MTQEVIERRPSLIGHDSKRVKNEVDLDEAEKKKPGVFASNSSLVLQAIDHGYVLVFKDPETGEVYGYNLIDYIISTFGGLPTDQFPRTRFQLVNVWGEVGAMKTNLAVQLVALAAGCYEEGISEDEWRSRWAWVREMCIVNREDLIRVGDKIAEEGNARFPVLLLDDVDSVLGKQMSWEDQELYRLVHQTWGMIRRVVGCIITTEPDIEMVQTTLQQMMSFEVIVYPGSRGNPSVPSYKAERMCSDIHPYFRAKNKLTKIVVEDNVVFDPQSVPTWWWETYQPATTEEGRKTFKKMVNRMRELEDEMAKGGPEAEKKKANANAVRRVLSVPELEKTLRSEGVKISEHQAQRVTRKLKEVAKEKLGVEEP